MIIFAKKFMFFFGLMVVQAYQLTAMEKVRLPFTRFNILDPGMIAYHIVSEVLDLSDPASFEQSIRDLNQSCIFDTTILSQALQICMAREGFRTFEIENGRANRTILHKLCIRKGNAEIIKIIIDAALNNAWTIISMLNCYNRSAMDYAVERGDLATIKVFLDWAKAQNKVLDLIFMKGQNVICDSLATARRYDQTKVIPILEQAIQAEQKKLHDTMTGALKK